MRGQCSPCAPRRGGGGGRAAPRRGSTAPWRSQSRCGRRCRTASAGTVAPGHPDRARPGPADRRPVPPAAAPSGPRAAPDSAGRRAAGRGACATRLRSWCLRPEARRDQCRPRRGSACRSEISSRRCQSVELRQPRHLEPEHDSGAAHADLRDQARTRRAATGRSVSITTTPRPASRVPPPGAVLAARALRVLVGAPWTGARRDRRRGSDGGGHLAMDFVHAVLPTMCGRTIVNRMSTARVSTSAGNGSG